jgi:hypothetical protein
MPLIAILFTIFSALNFRIFLVKEIIKGAQPATLVMAFYIIGLYFFIFHTNNPWYFIYIIIFISGIYAIAALINSWKEMRLIIKIVSCILIIASIYPISSTGKTFNEYIQKHLSDYFPMSPAKYELYKKLKTISRKTDLILTPSLYSTKNKIADNYYPPAFTSRQFLLSGYRFGFGKNHPDFLARKNLCDNFNTASLTDYNQFKKYGIKFILIEKDIYDQETLSALEANILKTKNYSLIFENDAGIVAQVN